MFLVIALVCFGSLLHEVNYSGNVNQAIFSSLARAGILVCFSFDKIVGGVGLRQNRIFGSICCIYNILGHQYRQS